MPNILTADEFIAQGTTAGAILSIAEHPEQPRNVSQALRDVAAEVAQLTGQPLQVPGAVTERRRRAHWDRKQSSRRPANDNRSRHSGAPRNRRVA